MFRIRQLLTLVFSCVIFQEIKLNDFTFVHATPYHLNISVQPQAWPMEQIRKDNGNGLCTHYDGFDEYGMFHRDLTIYGEASWIGKKTNTKAVLYEEHGMVKGHMAVSEGEKMRSIDNDEHATGLSNDKVHSASLAILRHGTINIQDIPMSTEHVHKVQPNHRNKRDILDKTLDGKTTKGCYLFYDRSKRKFLTMSTADVENSTDLKICENTGSGPRRERNCIVKVRGHKLFFKYLFSRLI